MYKQDAVQSTTTLVLIPAKISRLNIIPIKLAYKTTTYKFYSGISTMYCVYHTGYISILYIIQAITP
jgi:hypothetical protein